MIVISTLFKNVTKYVSSVETVSETKRKFSYTVDKSKAKDFKTKDNARSTIISLNTYDRNFHIEETEL